MLPNTSYHLPALTSHALVDPARPVRKEQHLPPEVRLVVHQPSIFLSPLRPHTAATDTVKKPIHRRVSTIQSEGIADRGGAIREHQTACLHACLLYCSGPGPLYRAASFQAKAFIRVFRRIKWWYRQPQYIMSILIPVRSTRRIYTDVSTYVWNVPDARKFDLVSYSRLVMLPL